MRTPQSVREVALVGVTTLEVQARASLRPSVHLANKRKNAEILLRGAPETTVKHSGIFLAPASSASAYQHRPTASQVKTRHAFAPAWPRLAPETTSRSGQELCSEHYWRLPLPLRFPITSQTSHTFSPAFPRLLLLAPGSEAHKTGSLLDFAKPGAAASTP